MIDGAGFLGTMIIFSFMFTFCGTAFILFFYFWWKGRLDMDEEPALNMMNDNPQGEKRE